MIKYIQLIKFKSLIILLIIIFNYSCQEKTSGSSGSSNSSSSTGGTSTTLLDASYARDGYYKLTGLVAGSYTYSVDSGTLYTKIEWKGNGVVRRTIMGSVSYSYGGYSWTIDCSDTQITDVTLYSDGYVKSITLVDPGCGSATADFTVNWNKWAVSSIGITNTINITDTSNETYSLYYYYTADSFDYVIQNNASGKVINQVYFTPSSNSSWGSNHLSTTISYGETWTLWGIYPCGVKFDRKIIATDGSTWTKMDQYYTCWSENNGVTLIRSNERDLISRNLKSNNQINYETYSTEVKFNQNIPSDNNIKNHEFPF